MMPCFSVISFLKSRNWFTSQFLIIRLIIEGERARNFEATLLFIDFSKPFGEMEQTLLAYGVLKEYVTTNVNISNKRKWYHTKKKKKREADVIQQKLWEMQTRDREIRAVSVIWWWYIYIFSLLITFLQETFGLEKALSVGLRIGGLYPLQKSNTTTTTSKRYILYTTLNCI